MRKHWLILIIIFWSYSIQAQQEEKAGGERSRQFDTDVQQLERTNEQIIPQPQMVETALEKAVDSTQYVMGPGDKILIKVWGPLEEQFITEVTPEGFVVIPTIDEIEVSGLTLAESNQKIKETLANYFKEAHFTVRLLKMRKFRVFVVGEVRNPGTYYVRAADRVGDVLQLAGGLIQWGDDTRIQIQHRNGDPDTIDISRFYLDGTLEENPHLEGGDIIYVPPINLNEDYVIIEGNVGSEGIYQIRSGESLLAFLKRTRALNRKSNVDNVVLFRDGKKSIYNLLARESGAQDVLLQTGDRILVPTNRNKVYVKGAVAQPGPFPYLANYTAKDYAGLAGILDTAKDLHDIRVIRLETGTVENGSDVIVHKGDIVVVPKRNREVFKEYMEILTPIISIGLSAYALIVSAK